MKALIIDISASPLREYVHQHGVADGLLYGCWYRIVRPLLVILTWVAFSLYIHHSLVTVGGTAAQIAELLVYITVVATMAAALTAWMIVCRFHGWIRARDNEEVGVGLDPEYALPPRWPLPEGANRLLVDHDEAGAIVQVSAWYVPAAIEPVVAAAMAPVVAPAVMPDAAPLSEPAPLAVALPDEADEPAAWSGPPMQRQPDGRIEPSLHDGRALTL
ncbi:hypothetical protein [Bordetella bronchiseptica]|uniref:Membrane protein n=3 Tax=Bordetella bronchiseptica TaxID=518 RepID=A0A0H3LTS4_BORBR|nr:hypothetical protein [Bordetella bronchiseptica]SHR47756.1 Uncharacterised protein [Mycobacteroides abscessus subsp. abscessus]AMG88140.1 hypothetical protein AL472_10300 [Bordetella bronchiseptica]AWP74550.1 hypothetical protein B7P10_08805 [Bordetella bronchiseptica]AWP84142.1 hypothetical protein B7P00_08585 [Bordetella bronchiseptica]AWQ09707.1 hypothetical protein B9G72_08575 [Bordetella bronchiseptica]